MKTSIELRQAFLTYFKERGHTIVPSSSLIPENDPTLLFVNAGMVPFKDLFLGVETRGYTRATSSQRCVRAGGKHNDLENVGYTARHHTFFEMLGNFSFGDYFKKTAIQMCWEFLTVELKIPKERLWVSVFKEDKETADIWVNDMGFDPERISFCGEKDNFWTMGDTGPCGPCSEIFYDHGADIPGGPPGTPEEDGDRYIEIWNMVFMQYDRKSDGTLVPLPKPSVDTGMGLERLSAVMQGVHNNYDTDLFTGVIRYAAKLADITDLTQQSLRVLADHIRSTSFLIVDGVVPSNEGRGYVLRRIIRRAIRHGNKLGMPQPFFYQLLTPLIEVMGEAYPELLTQKEKIIGLLRREEVLFMETLSQGLKLLEKAIADMSGDTLSGETVFKLYDTYGFPADLTADIVRERGLHIDDAGFNACMAKQRDQSRAASQFGLDYTEQTDFLELLRDYSTEFVGYDHLNASMTLTLLLKEGVIVPNLQEGDEGILVADVTPFYAESGGQVGDVGVIKADSFLFEVTNTTKEGAVVLHHGKLLSGDLSLGDAHGTVDENKRPSACSNHSATHLLHHVLRVHLGDHVVQKGSLVTADRLRFDFTHFEPVSAVLLEKIENDVNALIRSNFPVDTTIMTPDQAKADGAMALFGEKYGQKVRVLSMGPSKELCGGTHVKHAGDIGLFAMISESGVASGVRRIEAVTGQAAIALYRNKVRSACSESTGLQQKIRIMDKEIARYKSLLAAKAGGDLSEEAKEINGVKVVVAEMQDADVNTLRETIDQLKNKLGDAVVVLAAKQGEGLVILAGVSTAVTAKVKAGELVNHVASQVGGKGGGRPDFAQAGGNQPENLPVALDSVAAWLEERL